MSLRSFPSTLFAPWSNLVTISYWTKSCLVPHNNWPGPSRRLSRLILSDDSIAAAAAVLFCLNPASIFHSTFYTEAPFSALTLAGLYYLHRSTGPGDWLLSSALLAGSTSVRSNGITNAWFIGHAALQKVRKWEGILFTNSLSCLREEYGAWWWRSKAIGSLAPDVFKERPRSQPTPCDDRKL